MIEDEKGMLHLNLCGGPESPGSVLENEKVLLYPDFCDAADLVLETHSAGGCFLVAQVRGLRVPARTLFFSGVVKGYDCPPHAEAAWPHSRHCVGVCSSFPLSVMLSLSAATSA